MRFSFKGLALALGALLGGGALQVSLVACDPSGPSGPSGPGVIQFDLLSPNGPEGAAVFEITGGIGLGVLTAQGGDFFHQSTGGTIHVVVVLDNPGQIRFQVEAENVRQLPSVKLVQVADGANALRTSLSGYDVQILPVAEARAP